MLASVQNPPPLRKKSEGGWGHKHRLTKCKPQIKLNAKHIQINDFAHQAADLHPHSVWPAVLLFFAQSFVSSCSTTCDWQVRKKPFREKKIKLMGKWRDQHYSTYRSTSHSLIIHFL